MGIEITGIEITGTEVTGTGRPQLVAAPLNR